MGERLDQIGGHVTSYMQSDIGESFVGTEPQGAMGAKNNVERIEMKSDKTPDPTHVKDKNEVDDEKKEVVAEGLCSLGKNLPSKKPASMSPDTAEDNIDLEEESSGEEEDTLVHHVKPSAARKLKTRKEKTVAEMMASRTRKKTADISPAKRQTIKKCPSKAAAVHLDNISFHLEDGAAKWTFVIQRRVAVERELGKEVVEVKEVMDLINNAGLIKIVVALPRCYEGLVKEFVVNIPEEISERSSREFYKVFLRGRCARFSPTIINKFLGR
ncbi:uncharacterized protein LOC127103036 [Lathyrus oleraceus]|uniref:uncharacterized protein LOC127103036 n=1 Tax=Pisum sativum TaxID=3888 RepID=UPI0021CE6CFC|nr:uncharacterized protein LOC127103036 [Pisum sativum]